MLYVSLSLSNKKSATVTKVFQIFHAKVVTKGYKIAKFRCDNGHGKYNNQVFRTTLQELGISFEPCLPYTQHKNRVAERMIRTLVKKTRAMLLDANVPIEFWGEAITTACYLH